METLRRGGMASELVDGQLGQVGLVLLSLVTGHHHGVGVAHFDEQRVDAVQQLYLGGICGRLAHITQALNTTNKALINDSYLNLHRQSHQLAEGGRAAPANDRFISGYHDAGHGATNTAHVPA